MAGRRGSKRTDERDKTTCVKRYIKIEHRAHAINDSRMHDGNGRVEVAADFAARAFEIEDCRTFCLVDLDAEMNLQGRHRVIAINVSQGRKEGRRRTGEPSSR